MQLASSSAAAYKAYLSQLMDFAESVVFDKLKDETFDRSVMVAQELIKNIESMTAPNSVEQKFILMVRLVTYVQTTFNNFYPILVYLYIKSQSILLQKWQDMQKL